MADDLMPKFDPDKHKNLVNKATLDFMKLMQEKNKERVLELRRTRLRNIYTGVALSAFVLGVYSYSLISVKQETFLDDFEPPELLPKPEINK